MSRCTACNKSVSEEEIRRNPKEWNPNNRHSFCQSCLRLHQEVIDDYNLFDEDSDDEIEVDEDTDNSYTLNDDDIIGDMDE